MKQMMQCGCGSIVPVHSEGIWIRNEAMYFECPSCGHS